MELYGYMKAAEKSNHSKMQFLELKFFKLISILCLVSSFVGLPSLSEAGNKPTDKLIIFVVNYPLKYFAERIAEDHAKVILPAPADEDPAYWMPDVKAISEYQKADLILLNGAGYAKWVSKVSLPRSRMINTSASFKDQYITTKEAVTHSHGTTGKHAHENVAFTTWLDFNLALKQAKAVAEALARKRPALQGTFKKNYVSLEKDLMELDSEMKALAATNQSEPLVASHPVYDYLARRYGLNIRSLHWEPEERPNEQQWIELRNMLKVHPAKWLIWEGAPLEETVGMLKARGIKSIVFDPCGNRPETGDFMSVMRQNLKNLKTVLKRIE